MSNGREFLVTMLSIYPITRILLSMLRPSSISNIYCALSIDIPIENKRKYMKFEREIVPNTKELYELVSSGHKVLIAGLEIDRIKERIYNPNYFYTHHLDSRYFIDKVWIVIIKNNIDEVSSTMRQLEPLNINWHKRYCGIFNSTCRCERISNAESCRVLLDHDNVWYQSDDFKEDGIVIYYHPGRQYCLTSSLAQDCQPYVSLTDEEIRNLSIYASNNYPNIQYVDIEDTNRSTQISKITTSKCKTYRQVKVYHFSYLYSPRIIYI